MTQPPTGGQQPPGWQAPGTDGDAGAGWGAPGYGTPGQAQPGWGQPGPPQPAQPQPGWGQPAQPQPGWGQPGQAQAGWGQSQGPTWAGPQVPWTPAQAQPGIVPLRPLSVGEILDGSFQAIRANPRSMIGVSAVVVAAVTLLSIVPQALVLHGLGSLTRQPDAQASAREQLDYLSGLLGAQLLPGLLTFIAVTMLNALLIVPVSAAVLGRRVSPAEMWQRARGRLLPALGLALLTPIVVVLAVLVVAAVFAVPGIFALSADQTGLGALLVFVGVVAAVVVAGLLTTRWALAAPALVLERAGVTTALRRSWRLTRQSFWRVFGILLLTGIIVAIGQAVISVPTGVLSSLPAAGQDSPYDSLPLVFAQLLISGVGSIVSGAVFYPFSAAASALLYIDLRMRREGLDVRLAQSAAEGGPMP